MARAFDVAIAVGLAGLVACAGSTQEPAELDAGVDAGTVEPGPDGSPPVTDPLAEAGHARTVSVADWVTVDGTGSAVPADCSPVWSGDLANPGDLAMTGDGSLTPRVSPAVAGTYRLTLSIACADGATSTDDMLVHAFARPVPSFADQRFVYRVEGVAGDNVGTSAAGREYVFDPAAYPDIDGGVTEVWIDVRGQRLPMDAVGGGRFSRWVPDASVEEDRWYWAFVGDNRFAQAPVLSVHVEAAGAGTFAIHATTPLAAGFGGTATTYHLVPDSAFEDAAIAATGAGRYEVTADFDGPRQFYVVAENASYRSFASLVTLPPAPAPVTQPRLGVIYQVYVKHFADSDGDGIGDLPGLIDKLSYLRDDLGVDTILLMPVFAAPGTVGWGYAPTDLSTVHPDYGTNADLVRLFERAHARGMRVLVDVPMNHVHRTNPACEQAIGDVSSPTSSWFHFFDDNREWFGWDFRDDGAHSHFFARRQSGDVAVNLDDPDARAAIASHVVKLLDPNGDGDLTDGADGFRLDYVKGPSKDFWRELGRAAVAVNPNVALVGEAWTGPQQLGVYLREAGLNGVFDFPFQYAVRGALEYGDAGRLYWQHSEGRTYYEGAGLPVPFVANHDVSRLVDSLDGDDAGIARAAASIVLTAPGNPLVFFGDEIGLLAHDDEDFDRKNGGPFVWAASDPAQTAAPGGPPLSVPPSLAAQQADPNSLYAHYRALLGLRRDVAPLGDERAGAWHYSEFTDPGLYAVVRPSGGERALVVVNLTGQTKQVSFSEQGASTLVYRDGLGAGAQIGPYGTHVYRLP